MAARGGSAGGAGLGSGPSAGTAGEAAEPALRPGEVAALHPQEVAARLQRMRRELSNRRKILVKNLPQDSSSQEVHDLLQDYELKYCYVDRNKRTAFVTLLNGEQAQSAIQRFHQFSFRGRELIVQLQPTDALLCITNLPISFTLEEFEELVRAYGNIERCFLVYSEVTGHSKGYGFVEYMKKDFAAKARLELLGRQMGASALFAQWMDVNLLASELIHSKCLCIDKLPSDYRDSEELLQLFSGIHKPVFCELAQDEGGHGGGFAVVEYSTAEHAEEVQQVADGITVQGSQVQLSFCAPGAPGRSTLAALIAAQRVSSVVGSAAPLLLQNLSHLPLVQQQLMKFENTHTNNLTAGQAGLGRGTTQEKQSASAGITEASFSGSQQYLQTFPGLPAGGPLTGHQKTQQSQPKGAEVASKNQTSLLGEPPKEIRLSKNPYLNLASVLPSVCLSTASKGTPQKTGIASNILDAISQGNESQHVLEKCITYSPPFEDYAQVSSLRNEKRGSSYLISAPEGGPVELAGQHPQDTGVSYTESYLKKKRVY
ncbi:ribonucleoprotein PTB-binding 2 [Cricetulus griseus]